MLPFELKLKKVIIDGFRGFKDPIEISIEESLTVFIGDNGSGKTSVLDAIAVLLAALLEQYVPLYANLSDRHSEMQLSKFDVNNTLPQEASAKSSADFELNDCLLTTYFDVAKDERLDMRYGIEDSERAFSDTVYATDQDGMEFRGGAYFEEIKRNSHLPVLAYYPCRMVGLETPDPEKLSTDIYSTYEDALTPKALDFKVFKKWFAWQQNKQSDILHNIKQAILIMLNDDKKSDYMDIRIDWTVIEGQFVLEKQGILLFENQLSSGEKSLLSLVGDLARRLCLANPKSENPLNGSGIVLIDEIDLHLHPKWQRKVVGKLREIFPNIQFLVTTHSPTLLGTLDRKHIKILRNGQIVAAPFTKGRDMGAVYEEAFGVSERPEAYQKKLADFYRLLEENVEAAENILNELKADWGEDDEEITRANSYIEIY